MTTPARDGASAEQEQGTGELSPGVQHAPLPAPSEAEALIARLRQRVQVWIDSDRVLPADGSLLLAALEQAVEGLIGSDGPAARAGIAAFIGRVQSLIEAGILPAADGQPPLEAAAALAGLIPSAGGSGGSHSPRRDERREP